MVDPVAAALQFGSEVLLLYGIIAVLFVAIVRKDGHGSTFRYALDRSRVGTPFVLAVVLLGLAVTYLAYLDGIARWGGELQPGPLGFAVVTLGIGLLGYTLTAIPAYRALAGQPRTEAVSVTEGETAFCIGQAVATHGTTTAPVSGADALLWEVRTERESTSEILFREYTSTGVDSIETDAVPFTLEDSTGRLRVDPTDATMACSVGAVATDDAVERTERRLDPEEPVAVFGTVENGTLVAGDGPIFLVGDLLDPEAETPVDAFHPTGPHGAPVAKAVVSQVRRGIPLGVVVTLVGAYLLFGG